MKLIPPPVISSSEPSVVTLWHGGRDLPSNLRQIQPGGGQWEYGPGLYCHTDVLVASSYAKGGRALYRLDVKLDRHLKDVERPVSLVADWVKQNLRGGAKRSLSEYLADFQRDAISLETVMNLCVNAQGSGTREALLDFLQAQGAGCFTERALGNSSGFVVVLFDPLLVQSITKVSQKDYSNEWLEISERTRDVVSAFSARSPRPTPAKAAKGLSPC